MGSANRKLARPLVALLALVAVAGAPGAYGAPAPGGAPVALGDVTGACLIGQPAEPKFSMAAAAADLDGDGDLDLVIAAEYAPNRILVNDGHGRMTDESDARLPRITGDHEDVAIADFDGDGDLDLLFVGEDDQVYGYHLNDGRGYFSDVTDRIPVRATSNAVVAADFDMDGDQDVVIGNDGPEAMLVNDGRGRFTDESASRLPGRDDVTQDIEVGDLYGDGDPDLVLGNEDGNRLLLNDGAGAFDDATGEALPPGGGAEETRDADLADVDGDGDLDLYLANVQLFSPAVDPQDRLLLNDGTGRFSDVTADAMPVERRATMTAALLDLDGDGDPDLVTGTMGDITGETAPEPWRVALNDGEGRFSEAPDGTVLPPGTTGNGFDVEPGDFDGDGRVDLFLASRGGTDRLLSSRPGGCQAGEADATPVTEMPVASRPAPVTAG